MSRLKKIVERDKDKIIQRYKTDYSVYALCRDFGYSGGTDRHVANMLKEEGLYQGVGGLSAKSKASKIKETCKKKYGVDNISKLDGYGWSNKNSRDKIEVKWVDDKEKYCEEVDRITKINKKRMIDTKYCHYTGIKFADFLLEECNPNDQLKRTVDHKTSKFVGYLLGIPPEEIADVGNLVYCLRFCNTVKNIMTEEQFLPFAEKIREKFINEGHESN